MSEYRFFLYHADLGNWTRIPDPKGWDGLHKTRQRFGGGENINNPWHGLFNEYTAKVSFIKAGKNIIQSLYERYGIEQEVILKIEKKDTKNHRFNIDYEGRLNFTTYEVNTTEVNINVEQIGFTERIKNGNEIKINIEALATQDGKVMDAAPMITLPLHSKSIQKKSIFNRDVVDFTPAKYPLTTLIYNEDVPALKSFYLMPNFIIEENGFEDIFTYRDQYQDNPFEDDIKYGIKPKGTQSGTLAINSTFTFKLFGDALSPHPGTASNTVDIIIKRQRGSDFISETINVYSLTVAVSLGLYDTGFIDVNVDASIIDFEPGDLIFYYLKYTTDFSRNFLQFDLSKTNKITFLANTVTPATDCQAIMIHEALQRTVESLTGKQNSFYSEHFGRTDLGYAADGEGALRAITSVNKIRGIDKPLQCSLDGLIQTAWALDAIGVGIERVNGKERIRVEPLTHWYQTRRMMTLDFILDISKNVTTALYNNQAEGGIAKWGNEQIANLDEPNSKKEWTFPITQIKSKLDLKSPYITGSYTIEFARRERDQPTKDTRADEENVIIRVLRDGDNFVPEKNEAFTSVTGVISPETSYNLADSPARCFRRHGRILRSFLEKQKTDSIKFQAGEANNLMTSQLVTETEPLIENADILISSLDKPLLIAETYSFRARLNYDQLIALNETDSSADENSLGFIEFSKTDKAHERGYLLSAKMIADSDEVVFKLIKANI